MADAIIPMGRNEHPTVEPVDDDRRVACGFSKSARLLYGLDFKRVQSRGRKFAHGAAWLYVARGEGDASRIGLTVSRKVGKACVRNRIKRLAREYFRQHRMNLIPPVDCVLIARPRAAQLQGPDFHVMLEQLFARIPEKHR